MTPEESVASSEDTAAEETAASSEEPAAASEEPAANDPTANTAADIVTAFESFLNDNAISAGAIAVHFNNELVAGSGVNRTAAEPAPVASLSKAITAVCTFKALELTGTSVDSAVAQLLPDLFTTDTISDERMNQITVTQLITHNSGIHTAHLSALGPTVETMQAEQKLWQFEFIADDGLSADPGSGYYYANANYLILGLLIEQLSGEDYETWCRSNVLAPLGISTARLSPLWTILTSYGGWEISASDYAIFVDANFSERSVLGENPDTFATKVALNDTTYYGPGTLMRQSPMGYLYWHSGSFTWQSSQQSGRFGAYFASYANGFTVSVNLDTDLNDARGSELDSALYRAAHGL